MTRNKGEDLIFRGLVCGNGSLWECPHYAFLITRAGNGTATESCDCANDSPEANPRCKQCGVIVSDDRAEYATPMCFACLPPPDPLPVDPHGILFLLEKERTRASLMRMEPRISTRLLVDTIAAVKRLMWFRDRMDPMEHGDECNVCGGKYTHTRDCEYVAHGGKK